MNEHRSTPWHPWRDKTGVRHIPTYFSATEQAIFSTLSSEEPLFRIADMESLLTTVCDNGLFVLVHDLLSEREFPYANDLIGTGTPYFTKAGNVVSMTLKHKKKTGLLVSAHTWQWDLEPNKELVQAIRTAFRLFGFEASTPSSLSEKVLRATLPDYVGIYRPSVWLRRDILKNSEGGRIDKAIPAFYKEVKEFDKNKAYLYHSRIVPSPFLAPVHCGFSKLSRIMGFPVGFWRVRLVACSVYIHPIHIQGVAPEPGEVIEKWLWTGEIQDCLDAGYKFLSCDRGWGFRAMSNFMEEWSDILWSKYEMCKRSENPALLPIIKAMMVGLPGRFLRAPENFELIPFSDITAKTDIPLMLHPIEGQGKHFSDWAIRPVYNQESTALSYIGSYIVAEMRRELYHRMREEVRHGYRIVRSYVDSYSIADGGNFHGLDAYPDFERNIGNGLGQWKQKSYTDVWAEENRLVGLNEEGVAIVKAPGFERNGGRRLAFLQKYRRIVEGQHL